MQNLIIIYNKKHIASCIFFLIFFARELGRQAQTPPPPPKERKVPISQRKCYENTWKDENLPPPPSDENPPPPKEITTHRDFFPREVADERLL